MRAQRRFPAFGSLCPGLDNGKPIVCTFDGPAFRGERFCDELLDGRRYRHTGWYTDTECYSTARGIVARLAHGRFIAGYYLSENDERVYYPESYDNERDAAYAADGHAEYIAEREREHAEKCDEVRNLEFKIETKLARVRELILLRHKLPYARKELLEELDAIRDARETLQTEFKEYL